MYAARGHNFLLTILKLAKERGEISIVADQTGSPTSARLIAETTILCIQQALQEKHSGVFNSDLYHLTASNSTSWHGFAAVIVNTANNSNKMQFTVKDIKEIKTSDYPTRAKRPKNSRLELKKLESVFGVKMPSWEKALELCLEELR